MDNNSVEFLKQIYPEFKFWGSLAGTLWAVFKGLTWIKELKTRDLASIQISVGDVKTSVNAVHEEMKAQTSAIVREFQEFRADFRTFYGPPRARAAARKKKK